MSEFSKYSAARLNDRQTTELVGIARGLVADGILSDAEIEFLHRWLVAATVATPNPLLEKLLLRIEDILSDGIVDPEERAEVLEALHAITGPDFAIGEMLKPTTLPLCNPAPDIAFDGHRFTFTGAFVFGKRKECEQAVIERGGDAGSLRKDTAFLVIGEYASDDWIHSSYGRKIEKAMQMKQGGVPVRIVSEAHWRGFLG
ncbi:BRCT domain-containing protein [Meridianimarinicoccus sp. RP-17]|uniref:BRCT domain-containing protein n=1 Tax=Meridianimarinicoccus zhengii TaxID=2056810 RepID=UPI000DAD55C1|nr:BRCT domain-containing protein [Phycocomes zhengii]